MIIVLTMIYTYHHHCWGCKLPKDLRGFWRALDAHRSGRVEVYDFMIFMRQLVCRCKRWAPHGTCETPEKPSERSDFFRESEGRSWIWWMCMNVSQSKQHSSKYFPNKCVLMQEVQRVDAHCAHLRCIKTSHWYVLSAGISSFIGTCYVGNHGTFCH